MLSKRVVLLVVTACCLLALTPSTSYAQETTAGVQGSVKDPTGAVIGNATVEISGPALIGEKKLQTDQSGYYRFANLPPGTYTLTVTTPGFRTYKRENISLATGRLPSIDITLELGTATET